MTRGMAGFVAAIGMLAALAGTSGAQDKTDKPADKLAGKPATVAVFRLNGTVQEQATDDPFALAGGKPVGLRELVARLKKAARDEAVKAVVLLYEGGSIGPAQLEEVRQAMAGVRAAGKEVFAHADSLDMKSFVLLSGAGRLGVVPTGDLWVTGLYGESPYLRGLLNLLGVKPDFLTCGDYKSAAEIFMRDGPSPEAEKMQNWLLDSLFDTYLGLVADGRKVDRDRVKAWIDGGPYTAEKARAAGLIDAVEHRQDLEGLLKSKFGADVVFDKTYGEKKAAKVDLKSPLAAFKILGDLLGEGKKPESKKPAVAVVYVDGAITLGGSGGLPLDEGGATARELRQALDKAARDDAIKGVVLRVDSPGGSAVASEIILDATKRVKAKKPFAVSMGDVAGSGGYYVSCGADTIFADAATITGSIGVVSGKVATRDLFRKVGVTFKSYQRGAHAGMLNSNEGFTPAERERMQATMDEIYKVFRGHVVEARGAKLKKPIDELAGGRVYTGRQALELGLVDRIGTLDDAVRHVAEKAGLADYEVRVVPPTKSFIEKLLEDMAGEKESGPGLVLAGRRAGRGGPGSLVELALPYLRHLDRDRLALVTQALGRLELIRTEGAVLMMPEIAVGR